MNEHVEKMKKATSPRGYRLRPRTIAEDLYRGLILPLDRLRKPNASVSPGRFVVFGQGRCGSKLLVSLLDSHPRISCKSELLSARHLFPLAQIEYLRLQSQVGIHLFGFHLKPWHITDVLRKSVGPFMRRMANAGYQVVYLRRENLFLQALSQAKLFMYGVVHAKTAAAVPKGDVLIDAELLLRLMKNLERHRRLEVEGLGVVSDPIVTISYEADLLDGDSHQAACDRVFHFLGVEPSKVESPHRKVSPSDWRLGVENFQEVEAAVLRGGFGSFIAMADGGGPQRRAENLAFPPP